MAVYAVFIPRRGAATNLDRMERFPNIEHAGRILKERAYTRKSRTYYPADGRGLTRPTARFARADRTASLVVWIRPAADGAPEPGDPHMEVWTLRAGGTVHRQRV